jgi:hypothetical protein
VALPLNHALTNVIHRELLRRRYPATRCGVWNPETDFVVVNEGKLEVILFIRKDDVRVRLWLSGKLRRGMEETIRHRTTDVFYKPVTAEGVVGRFETLWNDLTGARLV